MDNEVYKLPLNVRLERLRRLLEPKTEPQRRVMSFGIDLGGAALVLGLIFLLAVLADLLR